jgi:regulator of protease activity HflC (stomatin/prohibitin superfamily)
MLNNYTKSIMAVVLMTALSGCVLPYNIGPTEVAVKTNKTFIGGKGVQEELGESGATKFYMPFMTQWDSFETKLQTLEMSASATSGDRMGADDMQFKTIDGNDISLDVTITYFIIPEKAAYILQNVATTDQELKEHIVRTVARSKPRDIFGELETEGFYDAVERSAKAEEAKSRLNEIMKPYGIVIDRVNTGDYRFNPEYQQAIEEKKIADQQVEKNKSSAKAAEEEYLRKVEEAKGEVSQMIAKANGSFEVAKIEADAYLEQQKKIAQAIEAEGRAEAEGIMKMNEALSGGGGEAMVKLKIAESLKGKKIIMLPIGGGGLDVRSTDINSLLELYGIQSITNK